MDELDDVWEPDFLVLLVEPDPCFVLAPVLEEPDAVPAA